MFEVGKFKITPLEFGRFKLDGGAMFGVIPKVLWEKQHASDEFNRIEMALRCLLIEVDNRRILVDTGFGEERTEKFKKIFNFRGSENYLQESLSRVGLEMDQITDVILTHLHFDHDGGATKNKSTKPIPSFPNAKYYFQEKQIQHARRRLERDKASYLQVDFEPLFEYNAAVVKNGEWELIPGLDFVICNGHTPGMQLPRIRENSSTYIYGADLIPLASQFPLPWIMAYDLYPVTTLEEKRTILSKAAEEEWIFLFEHDPNYVSSKVKKDGRGSFILDI